MGNFWSFEGELLAPVRVIDGKNKHVLTDVPEVWSLHRRWHGQSFVGGTHSSSHVPFTSWWGRKQTHQSSNVSEWLWVELMEMWRPSGHLSVWWSRLQLSWPALLTLCSDDRPDTQTQTMRKLTGHDDDDDDDNDEDVIMWHHHQVWQRHPTMCCSP